MKPAVPSGPRGNRITLSSMRRNSSGFGEDSCDDAVPFRRVLFGEFDVPPALLLMRPYDGDRFVKLSAIEPFVALVPLVPLPFRFSIIADSLYRHAIESHLL